MNQLEQAFGKKFIENKSLLRIRSFEMAGYTFKVKVPLTSEYDAILERIRIPNEEKIQEYYNELTKDLKKEKESFNAELGVIFEENDIKVQGRSMLETAKNKLITENRILEMIKLLVPEEGHTLEDITYKDVEELFPFSVQLEIIEHIGETISPSYKEIKGK